MPIGQIFTSDTINKALRDYNKNYYGQSTWNTLYNQVENAEQRALSQIGLDYQTQKLNLEKSYAETIAEAYNASKASNMQIAGSNLGSGYRNALIADNQNALQKAYEQYKTNYQQSLSELSSGYEENVANITSTTAAATNEIDTLLNEQSSNVKSYLNYANNYIDYLYNNNPELFENLAWSRYLNEDGAVKSYDEIFSTDAGTLTYDDTSDQYYLTDKGREIYQQIFNERGFGKYLQNTDAELYDWLYSTGYDNSRNIDMIYNDVLGFTDDSWTKYTYENKFVGLDGTEYTEEDFYAGFTFDDNNLVDTDYVDDDFKDSNWYIDTTNDLIPSTGIDADEFFADNTDTDIYFGSHTGKKGGKRDEIYNAIKEKYGKNALKSGTVFDVNYGSGTDYLMYLNGKIYALTDNFDKSQRSNDYEQVAKNAEQRKIANSLGSTNVISKVDNILTYKNALRNNGIKEGSELYNEMINNYQTYWNNKKSIPHYTEFMKPKKF